MSSIDHIILYSFLFFLMYLFGKKNYAKREIGAFYLPTHYTCQINI